MTSYLRKPCLYYHNIFKGLKNLGINWVKSDMPGHAYKESITIRVFHLWYYITILNTILNGQTVIEIFKFEKSSKLIGREHFGQ